MFSDSDFSKIEASLHHMVRICFPQHSSKAPTLSLAENTAHLSKAPHCPQTLCVDRLNAWPSSLTSGCLVSFCSPLHPLPLSVSYFFMSSLLQMQHWLSSSSWSSPPFSRIPVARLPFMHQGATVPLVEINCNILLFILSLMLVPNKCGPVLLMSLDTISEVSIYKNPF